MYLSVCNKYMDDSEIRHRGNTDAVTPSKLYDDEAGMTTTEEAHGPDMAAFNASEFGQTEQALKAHIAEAEKEERERSMAWSAARKQERAQEEAHRLALAEETAAQERLAAERAEADRMRERIQPRPLQPQAEPGFIMKAAALLRSFLPSGQRKAA